MMPLSNGSCLLRFMSICWFVCRQDYWKSYGWFDVGISTRSQMPKSIQWRHWTCQWRAVNPVKVVDAWCSDVDPETFFSQKFPCGKTKISQLGLKVYVSDARQVRVVSLLTSSLSLIPVQLWSVGPETNLDVIVTLTELLTHHVLKQKTYRN